MSIYAIADLHLPGHNDKPMNVFGKQWDNHFETIKEHWLSLISPADIVLIAGDISWAMHFQDAVDDLQAIGDLPGRKIILRGNHDYWWSAIGKLRALLPEGMYALQNDALFLDGYVFCGTRGWTFPTEQCPLEAQDEKIYQRELIRLEMSLAQAQTLTTSAPVIAMMHFPPLLVDEKETAYSRMLAEAGVQKVVYGHLHGTGIPHGFNGLHGGVEYHLTSCDALAFVPKCIDLYH